MPIGRSLVTAVLALALASCDQTRDTGYTELPEDPRLHGRLSPEKLLRDARRSLESDRRELLQVSSVNIVGIAQAEHALRRLATMSDHRAEPPTTIAAHAGRDGRGESYLSVRALVPSREASRVRLAMSDSEDEVRTIVLELHPKHRALEYIVLHYFATQQQPWRSIKNMIPRDSERCIDVRSSARVPFPDEWGEVTCVVAIEDRHGALGNFVPVVKYDAAP